MKQQFFYHKIKKAGFSIFIFLLMFFCQVNGQKKLKVAQSNSPEVHDTMSVDKRKRNFMLTPYAAPSYSPELGVLFTAGGLMSFKIQPDNQFLERSSIPFSVGYSTNGSATITVLPYIYGRDNKYKIQTQFYYKNMPDNYWGVGYDNAIRTSSPDSTTSYHREWWSLAGQMVFKVKSGFNLGFVYDINATTASSLNSTMEQDPSVLKFGTHVRNLGLGIAIELDYRDNAQNPYSGYLLNMGLLNYNGMIASNPNNFNKVTLDARKYFPVGDRKTVALQFSTEHTGGDVPWSEMPQVGTPTDLRGYQWGRFRDKTATFGIAEYRHMITRKRINKKGSYDSRFGFATWVGVGCVSDNYATMYNWIPNGGIGLRVEIQPRMNLRIDYGIGKDSNAFYIIFSEAF